MVFGITPGICSEVTHVCAQGYSWEASEAYMVCWESKTCRPYTRQLSYPGYYIPVF